MNFRNLEGGGAKRLEDFLHKSYTIIDYNIEIRISLIRKIKIERLY
jgi:hypothetical protein